MEGGEAAPIRGGRPSSSFVTAATVGYGDVVPITGPGRMLAVFDSLLGMTVMGLIAGYLLGAVTPRQLP